MKQLKRVASLVLAVLLLTTAFTVTAASPIRVFLRTTEIAFDVPPQIINSRTMVPLRAIFEALGASVEWNGETQTVTSMRNSTIVQLTIGSPTMYVNYAPVALDSPACIVNSRTLVPVRAISEAFGISVEWDGANRIVTLGTNQVAYQMTLSTATSTALTPYKVAGMYGYLNEWKEWVTPVQFTDATEFANGYGLAKLNGVWYSIDTQGNLVNEVPYEFTSLNYSNGLVAVTVNGTTAYINTQGELVQ